MQLELKEINALVEKESDFIRKTIEETQKVIVGQNYIIERFLIGVLTGGHLLLEGVPGLAKTLSIKTLAQVFDVKFKRIQFTPDLLPADIIGTLIYNPVKQEFIPKLGPIFANFVLADEINRAPAKVQSALLEAMQEKQVTLADKTYLLKEPFLVLATQNPIEQEGTYNLPEAQVDRFLMKLKIGYPTKEEEKQILDRMTQSEMPKASKIIDGESILKARETVQKIYVDEKIKDYVLDIVFATRNPEKYNLESLKSLIDYGASPRASLCLIKAGKAHAFIRGRGYVTPEDIKAIGRDVLRHRVIPSFEAEAEELDSDAIIERIFSEIEVP
jgi:MoxR-like ATPase